MRLLIAFIAIGLLLLAVFRVGVGGSSSIPPMFDQSRTLQAAISQAAEQRKAVLVYATADWCGPCQQFKRTTLIDDEVEDYVSRLLVPVYLDVDEARDTAGSLGIQSIPTLIVFRGDQEVARVSGALPPKQMLAWLRDATGYE